MSVRSGTTLLLATNQQRTVLTSLDGGVPRPMAYTPYGHHPVENDRRSLVGFNGEQADPLTRHYHLGNGYRQFNPVLKRFHAPDSWSPFGEGGFNAYMYCAGDPVNRTDPSGHFWGVGTFFRRIFRTSTKASSPKTPVSVVLADSSIPPPRPSIDLTGAVVAGSPSSSNGSLRSIDRGMFKEKKISLSERLHRLFEDKAGSKSSVMAPSDPGPVGKISTEDNFSQMVKRHDEKVAASQPFQLGKPTDPNIARFRNEIRGSNNDSTLW